jgi:hypothetical protein
MPTNLALDDQLIEEAQRAGKHKTKKEAVNAALDEYVRKRKQVRILEAFGTFSVDPTYDYKAERQRKAGSGRLAADPAKTRTGIRARARGGLAAITNHDGIG